MKVDSIVLRQIRMQLLEPFATSYGVETHKEAIIVEVRTQSGAVGYAECVAGSTPHYTEETSTTAWHILEKWLIPSVFGRSFDTTDHIVTWVDSMQSIRGNRMAKAGLEMALWDAFAAETETALTTLLGGTQTEVPVGISVGLQASTDVLCEKINRYVAQGYGRVKLKIEPSQDREIVSAVRAAFPTLPIMVDANSAYSGRPYEELRWLDDFNLMMVEQPLSHDDLVFHSDLARLLTTPICLDESIKSAEDVRRAGILGSCRVVNVKAGRVGGFSEVLRIHNDALKSGMTLWCGGMLETGIGRLHNVALSSLPGFSLPGDTGPSSRYFAEDIVSPPVTFSRPGWLPVEPLCGVSSRVHVSALEACTLHKETFRGTI